MSPGQANGKLSEHNLEAYSQSLILNYEPSSQVTEGYRIVRTGISLQLGSIDNPILLVTSAGRGEGKSITCSNLGAVIAEGGQRVLIIDADLRLPSQHIIFGVERNANGVGTIGFDEPPTKKQVDAATCQIAPNLHLLPTGPAVSSPSEYLGSNRFAQVLDVVRPMYDVILIDSSPSGLVTDATLLASQVDAVIFVLSYNQTRRRFVKRSLAELRKADANILGVLLNRFPVRRSSHRSRSSGHLGGEYYASARG